LGVNEADPNLCLDTDKDHFVLVVAPMGSTEPCKTFVNVGLYFFGLIDSHQWGSAEPTENP
jgi:hypothetical protein